METTITSISVHPQGVNPFFGEGATHVRLDDEAAGPYLILEQFDDNIENGKVRIDFSELDAIVKACNVLIAQRTVQDIIDE